MIKKTKSDYYKEKLETSGNNSKMIWVVINEILSKRKKSIKIQKVKKQDGTFSNGQSETANTFNKYFVDVGKSLASKIPHTQHKMFSQRVPNSFTLFETTTEEVSKLIHDLNKRKGNCIGDIPTKIVKLSNGVIAPFLSTIFNACMSQGCYPKLLKIEPLIVRRF